jgi:hypothetical protein
VPSPPSKVMKPTIDLINSRLFAGRVPLYHANAGVEMADVRLSRG